MCGWCYSEADDGGVEMYVNDGNWLLNIILSVDDTIKIVENKSTTICKTFLESRQVACLHSCL